LKNFTVPVIRMMQKPFRRVREGRPIGLTHSPGNSGSGKALGR
jgi:hypothetical protein